MPYLNPTTTEVQGVWTQVYCKSPSTKEKKITHILISGKWCYNKGNQNFCFPTLLPQYIDKISWKGPLHFCERFVNKSQHFYLFLPAKNHILTSQVSEAVLIYISRLEKHENAYHPHKNMWDKKWCHHRAKFYPKDR